MINSDDDPLGPPYFSDKETEETRSSRSGVFLLGLVFCMFLSFLFGGIMFSVIKILSEW